jgi:hypothetical protein
LAWAEAHVRGDGDVVHHLGKIIRSVFPRLKTRRLGPRGKTKHHYHGISISSASKLQVHSLPPLPRSKAKCEISSGSNDRSLAQVPADAIITGKKAQNRRVRGPDVTASPPKRQRRAHKLMEDGYRLILSCRLRFFWCHPLTGCVFQARLSRLSGGWRAVHASSHTSPSVVRPGRGV